MFTPLLPKVPRILIHARGQMTPEETEFWQSLRFALREKNFELMLIGHYFPHKHLDAPLLKVRDGLDKVIRTSLGKGWGSWLPLPNKLDEENLLERERFWRGEEIDALHKEKRRRALYFFKSFYTLALKTSKPCLTVIWNGHHPQEMILDSLCKQCGCPVLYIERGPFQNTIQFDSDGILGGTKIANQKKWSWAGIDNKDYWISLLGKIKNDYQKKKSTWWSQPLSIGGEKLRRNLKIPENAKVLLFAGQIDEDSQNLLYSPLFKDNLSAFKWLCEQLSEKQNVFILGKHHPKSKKSPEDYNEIIKNKGAGVWINNVSLEDCLAISDRVSAVNSTVLYEALLMDKPILMMGKSLLSNKGIAYEINNLNGSPKILDEWLEASDLEKRKKLWIDFGAYLLAKELFSMKPPESNDGMRDAAALSDYLISMSKSSDIDYSKLDIDIVFIDEQTAWGDVVRVVVKSEILYDKLSKKIKKLIQKFW